MEASSVTDLLFKQLNFRANRQKVISTNIANMDTPGYKTKELKFKSQLQKAQQEHQLALAVTHQNHISVGATQKQTQFDMYEVEGLEQQNDGNNVNLDTQMSQMAQNTVMVNALQNSIKKDAAWFKSVVDASSKN